MRSVEFSHAGVRVYNNIYSENEGAKGKASSVWQRLRLGILERMYRVYRRQPESLKRAEKRILRLLLLCEALIFMMPVVSLLLFAV